MELLQMLGRDGGTQEREDEKSILLEDPDWRTSLGFLQRIDVMV